MAVIGSLSVKLGLVTQDFQRQMNDAKTQVGGLKSSFDSLNRTLGAFGVSLGATAIIGYGKQVMDFADEVQDLGAAFNLSVSKVLQFRDALGQSGGKAENAEKILGTLFDKIQAAKDGMITDDVAKQFQKLGLSISDLKQLQPEQALEAVFRGLSKINSTYERTALIKDLLGKGGLGLDVKNLADIMEQSSSKFDKNADSINRIADAADRLTRYQEQTKLFFSDLMVSVDDFINRPSVQFLINRLGESLKAIGGAAKMLTTGEVPSIYKQEQVTPPTTPGGYFGVKAGKTIAGIESVDLSAFQSKTKAPQISLGVAQKDIIDEAAIKRLANLKAQVELTKSLNEAEITQGKIRIDALTYDADSIAIREALLTKQQAEAEAAKKLAENKQNALGNAKELTEAQNLYNAEIAKANTIYQNSIDLIQAKWELQQQEMIIQTQSQQSFEYGWKSAFLAYSDEAENAAQYGADMFNTFTGDMTNGILEFARTGKLAFKDFAASVIQDLLRIAIRMQMMKLIGGIFSSMSSSVSINTEGMSGTIDLSDPNLLHKASGGFLNSASIVGENGPELFIPNRPGTIIPNARMGDFMGGQPSVVYNGPYIANMSAIDTQSATQFLARNKNAVFAANQSAQRSMPVSR